jgi:hypothetical protein
VQNRCPSVRRLATTPKAWLVLICLLGSKTGELSAQEVFPTKVIAEGYLANREAFPFLTCRFTLWQCKAKSVEDAVSGKFTERRHLEDVLWIVKGAKVRYEEACDPGLIQEAFNKAGPDPKSGKILASAPCGDQKRLSDGSKQLNYQPTAKGLTVSATGRAGGRIDWTPFSLGLMGADDLLNPGRLLAFCAKGKGSCRHYGMEKRADTEAVCVGWGYNPENQDKESMRFFLDPQRGFLPLEIRHITDTGQIRDRGFWMEIRRCSKDRWFPVKGVAMSGPREEMFNVTELQVTELDVDTLPPDDDFRLQVTKGTQIAVTEEDIFFILDSDSSLGLKDLPSLIERSQTATKKRQEAEVAAVANTSSFGPLARALVVAGAIGAIGLALCLLAWRSRSSRTSNTATEPRKQEDEQAHEEKL